MTKMANKKMATKKQLIEAPPTEYEKIRAQQMLRNNRMFQHLGINALVSMVRKTNDVTQASAVTTNDSTSAITQGSSSSEYCPKDDELNREDESDDTVVKQVKDSRRRKRCATRKLSNRKTNSPTSTPSSAMAPGRVLPPTPGATKRMLQGLEPEKEAPTRFTRHKGATVVTNMEEGMLLKDGVSLLHKDGRSLLHKDAVSSVHMDEESSMHMEEESAMQMDLSRVVTDQSPASFSEQLKEHTHDGEKKASGNHKRRGTGLEKITNGLGTKVTIEIPEGMKRPEKPMQAAKFASEGGYIVRGLLPVLPHFKEYKKQPKLVENFVGKVAASFQMDTTSDVVQNACADILQKVSKNRRHLIKKKYFDSVNANEVSIKSPVDDLPDDEWQRLVQLWSTPRHKKTCDSAKKNRKKVKFQQRTGSRSYAAHIYATKEERKGEVLTAVDLFKATHNSQKYGFSQDVQQAISKMESIMAKPVQEGAQPKSDVEAVADVLTKSSTFLKNVGLQSISAKRKFSKSDPAIAAHVNELEEKLERERVQNEAMREELAEIKAAQATRDNEFQVMLKRNEETQERFANMMALLGAKPL